MCLLFIVCIVCRCCCLWLSVVINVLFDLYVSSLRRGHASFLCIVPSLTDDLRRESSFVVATACGCLLFTSCVVTFICCGGFVVFVYGLYIYIYIYICVCVMYLCWGGISSLLLFMIVVVIRVLRFIYCGGGVSLFFSAAAKMS